MHMRGYDSHFCKPSIEINTICETWKKGEKKREKNSMTSTTARVRKEM